MSIIYNCVLQQNSIELEQLVNSFPIEIVNKYMIPISNEMTNVLLVRSDLLYNIFTFYVNDDANAVIKPNAIERLKFSVFVSALPVISGV